MKKFLTIALCFFLAFSFTACGGNGGDNSSKPSQNQSQGSSDNPSASQDSSSNSSQGGVELPEDKFD